MKNMAPIWLSTEAGNAPVCLELLNRNADAPGFNLGWLFYIEDEILPSYIGIIINHYKDPY